MSSRHVSLACCGRSLMFRFRALHAPHPSRSAPPRSGLVQRGAGEHDAIRETSSGHGSLLTQACRSNIELRRWLMCRFWKS